MKVQLVGGSVVGTIPGKVRFKFKSGTSTVIECMLTLVVVKWTMCLWCWFNKVTRTCFLCRYGSLHFP